jgi:hypothetical protein
VPEDLAAGLAEQPPVLERWLALSPARRREYVKSVLEAKKPETRGRRIKRIVDALSRRDPVRKTWTALHDHLPPPGVADASVASLAKQDLFWQV